MPGEVWYAIPSANPALCCRTLPVWREMGYRVAVLQNGTRGDVPADLTVWSDTYPGWAASINILCAQVVPRKAAIIVSGGDDMLPDPSHHADELAEQFHERFADGFGVMQPIGDGLLGARTFCGSPWLGRAWIERAYNGRGPMPAMYRHNWADNELYWVARCLDALWTPEHLTQRHEHFTRTGGEEPGYWTRNVSAHDRADVQTFIARSWLGFPGCEPRGGDRAFDVERFHDEYDRQAERYWLQRYGAEELSAGPQERMRAALQQAADDGAQRVALYGAGTFTRQCAAVLAQPPVEVACIIDDDPRRAGTRLWGWPIVTLDEARAHEVDAVIIASLTVGDALAARAAALPVRVLRVDDAAGVRV